MSIPSALLVAFAAAQTARSPVHRCCYGRRLTVTALAFAAEPWFTYEPPIPPTERGVMGGLLIRILDRVAQETGIEVEYLENRPGVGIGVAHNWFADLHDGYADATFAFNSDTIQVWSNTSVFGTVPLASTYWVMVVAKRIAAQSFWLFIEPFETSLWLAIAGVVTASAVAMRVFEHKRLVRSTKSVFLKAERSQIRARTSRPPLRFLGKLCHNLYSASAFALGGEDQEWTSWPARLFRLALLLFFYIIAAVYTGNLANLFIRPTEEILGPTSRQQLKTKTGCIPWWNWAPVIRPFVGHLMGPFMDDPSACLADCEQVRVDYCDRALDDGTADALIYIQAQLQLHSLRHCNTRHLVPSVNIVPMDWALCASHIHTQRVEDLR